MKKIYILFLITPLILFSEPIVGLENIQSHKSLNFLEKELNYYLSSKIVLTETDIKIINRMYTKINNYFKFNSKTKISSNDTNISSFKVVSSKKISKSKIKNNIEINNSKLKNSNTKIITDKNIQNSNIINNVKIIDSIHINSNLGIEIKKDNLKSKDTTIKSYIDSEDSFDYNSNNGNYIGN